VPHGKALVLAYSISFHVNPGFGDRGRGRDVFHQRGRGRGHGGHGRSGFNGVHGGNHGFGRGTRPYGGYGGGGQGWSSHQYHNPARAHQSAHTHPAGGQSAETSYTTVGGFQSPAAGGQAGPPLPAATAEASQVPQGSFQCNGHVPTVTQDPTLVTGRQAAFNTRGPHEGPPDGKEVAMAE